MKLKNISIVNYRNISQADLSFSPKLNGFIGKNGMGKTNVLDAIYYLSFCKGTMSASDAFNLRHDTEFFMIQGEYESDGMGATEVVCSLKRGTRKRVKCDGKDYKRISEHVGKIPLVMLSPADSQLVTGGSEERRRFMDMVISQYDAAYLNAAIRYERTLKQRNALLKAEEEPDRGVMDVLEEMMGADAEVVFNARRNFVEEFSPIFQRLYSRLCPDSREPGHNQIRLPRVSRSIATTTGLMEGTRTSGWLFAARRSQGRTRVGTEWLSSEARSVSGTDQDFFHRDETGTICFSQTTRRKTCAITAAGRHL